MITPTHLAPYILKCEFCKDEEIKKAIKDLESIVRAKLLWLKLLQRKDIKKWTAKRLAKFKKDNKVNVIGNPLDIGVKKNLQSIIGDLCVRFIEKSFYRGWYDSNIAVTNTISGGAIKAWLQMEVARQQSGIECMMQLLEKCK